MAIIATITAMIVGIITGILICVPVGPINVWVVNVFIKKGKATALSLALGASLMDFIYVLIILTGLDFFPAYFTNFSIPSMLKACLYLFGVLTIIILGIKELFTRESSVEISVKKIPENTISHLLGGFSFGVFLYVSNPTLIISMTAISSFILGLKLFSANMFNYCILAMGISLGTFLWFYFLIFLVNKYQEQVRNRYLMKFTKISGGLMLIFGLYLLVGLIRSGLLN